MLQFSVYHLLLIFLFCLRTKLFSLSIEQNKLAKMYTEREINIDLQSHPEKKKSCCFQLLEDIPSRNQIKIRMCFQRSIVDAYRQ